MCPNSDEFLCPWVVGLTSGNFAGGSPSPVSVGVSGNNKSVLCPCLWPNASSIRMAQPSTMAWGFPTCLSLPVWPPYVSRRSDGQLLAVRIALYAPQNSLIVLYHGPSWPRVRTGCCAVLSTVSVESIVLAILVIHPYATVAGVICKTHVYTVITSIVK